MSGEVLAFVDGPVGRLRLNRPKALHALTEAMCAAMIEALAAWARDPAVTLVLLDHAEGRGFCAGGDVRAAAADPAAARAFFHTEYRLNHLLFTYPKPIVAVMDGVVMGGGVGIALPADYRIATERTVFAMPEATIGLFPDVGGGWYLSRLPGRLGVYLALTAARLDGADCLATGLATHFIPGEGVEAAVRRLVAGDEPATALGQSARDPGPSAIAARQPEIDRLFAGDTPEAIDAALAANRGAWAADVRAGLRTKSPLSCKVALRLLAGAAARRDFAAEMAVEYGVALHLSAAHDFREGVRALLVDRDNAPRWDPPTAEGVTPAMLDAIFAPLPADQQWSPYPMEAEA